MNTELYPFSDIESCPNHYIYKLCTMEENSFLLFEYGPYLARNFASHLTDTLPIVKNDLLALLINIGRIISIVESKKSIGDMKIELCDVIKTANRYKYSDKIITCATKFLNIIRDEQYKSKSLESAMLNYSPIVPYMGTIVKPGAEMHSSEYFFDKYIDFSKLDKVIEDMFIEYADVIVLNDNLFIGVDSIIKAGNASEIVPVDILKNITTCDMGIATIYFSLVYLRFVTKEENYTEKLNQLFKINKLSNNLINGETIDIKEAVEVFGDIR